MKNECRTTPVCNITPVCSIPFMGTGEILDHPEWTIKPLFFLLKKIYKKILSVFYINKEFACPLYAVIKKNNIWYYDNKEGKFFL